MLKNSSKYLPYDYSSACSFYLGAIVCILISQGVAAVLSSALVGTYPDIADNGDFNTAMMIFFQIANAGFIVLFGYVAKRRFNFAYTTDTRTKKGVTLSVFIVPVIAAFVLMAAMYLPTTWYGYLTQAMGFAEDAGSIDLTTPSSVVMVVIAAVFLAPVFEETIYRGVLFHGLKSERGLTVSILLSATSFMLMHMSALQVVFQFALGVTTAYLVDRSGRLLPSIILHATANALALVMQMTDLAPVLSGVVEWLTANVTAAVFITLGLFVVGACVLVFGIDAAFGCALISRLRGKPVGEDEAVQDTASGSGGAMEAARAEAVRTVKRREGRFKYLIAIGICLIMFILSFVMNLVPMT